jgi:IMP dehydrogenase/GMP reductase
MLNKEVKYCYDDISIVPAKISSIEHRIDCEPYDEFGRLPIFTAPMDSVVNAETFEKYWDNGIIPILPRVLENSFETRLQYALEGNWAAFSLDEAEEILNEKRDYVIETSKATNKIVRILIDGANGHMQRLMMIAKGLRIALGDIMELMVGNIANPETFDVFALMGVDYIRVSIGTGQFCITSSNTGVHYPPASLLDEIYSRKKKLEMKYNIRTKVIADGGIRNYDDVVKALALGADYVMIGGLFVGLTNSPAKAVTHTENGEVCLYKVGYGMASSEGQTAMYGQKKRTAEGIKKDIKASLTIEKWTENMADVLSSAMSYCDITDIKDFNADNVQTIVISPNARQRINR